VIFIKRPSFHGAESLALALKISYLVVELLSEVSGQQTGESLAVASLVAVGRVIWSLLNEFIGS
jgi:hypothetical protein